MAIIVVGHGGFDLTADRVMVPAGLSVVTFVRSGQELPMPILQGHLRTSVITADGGVEFSRFGEHKYFPNISLGPVAQKLQVAFEQSNTGGHELLFMSERMVMCPTPKSSGCKEGLHTCGGLMQKLQLEYPGGKIYIGACLGLTGTTPEAASGSFQNQPQERQEVKDWVAKWGELNEYAHVLISAEETGFEAALETFAAEWSNLVVQESDRTDAFLSEEIGKAYEILDDCYNIRVAYDGLISNPYDGLGGFLPVQGGDDRLAYLEKYAPYRVMELANRFSMVEDFEGFLEFLGLCQELADEFNLDASEIGEAFSGLQDGRFSRLNRFLCGAADLTNSEGGFEEKLSNLIKEAGESGNRDVLNYLEYLSTLPDIDSSVQRHISQAILRLK
jgi:hypothetical protein